MSVFGSGGNSAMRILHDSGAKRLCVGHMAPKCQFINVSVNM